MPRGSSAIHSCPHWTDGDSETRVRLNGPSRAESSTRTSASSSLLTQADVDFRQRATTLARNDSLREEQDRYFPATVHTWETEE